MNGFTWEARRTGDSTVLQVGGDIDLATSDFMVATATAHLLPGGELVVDCSGITFLDSCGLRGLLEISRQASVADVTLFLADPSECVRRVMELSGTQDCFTFCGVEPAAYYSLDGASVLDTGTPR